MNVALWIVAGLLAAVFLAGSGKLFVSREKLATMPGGGWVEDFSDRTLKVIGAFEVLAAVGLVLPAALDIAPVLVPVAALGGAVLMIGAVITRLRRHEAVVLVDLAYFTMAAFVAWGRFGPEPFTG